MVQHGDGSEEDVRQEGGKKKTVVTGYGPARCKGEAKGGKDANEVNSSNGHFPMDDSVRGTAGTGDHHILD